jgi:hypothetical protein
MIQYEFCIIYYISQLMLRRLQASRSLWESYMYIVGPSAELDPQKHCQLRWIDVSSRD